MKTVLVLILGLCPVISFAHPGVGIVMDSKGNVFYTDTERVWRIDTNNKKSIVIPDVHTHELYLDEHDNLFGEHLWYEGDAKWAHYVWKYTAAGKFEKTIQDREGFLTDYSFVRDHFGNMFWADWDKECQKVVRMDIRRNKKLLGDQCLKNIRWMYVGKDDAIYLVDFQDLKRVDKLGKIKTIATQIADKRMTISTVENQNSVFGVWDDEQGNIYTAVSSNREVKKFDQTGKDEIVLRTSAPWTPTGGLVSPVGELWVLECSDTNAVRVERVSKDGTRKKY